MLTAVVAVAVVLSGVAEMSAHSSGNGDSSAMVTPDGSTSTQLLSATLEVGDQGYGIRGYIGASNLGGFCRPVSAQAVRL